MDEDDLYRRVGQAISQRRRALKLKQDHVAKVVGLSRASLANIETGRQKILLHYLYRLAAVLDLSSVDAFLPAGLTVSAEEPPPISGDKLSAKQQSEVLAFVANATSKRRRRGDSNA